VFHLAGLLKTRVELLTMIVPTVFAMVRRVVATVRHEHASTLLRQDDGHVPMTVQPLGADKPLLAQMTEVA
jgi:hypothetical protein